MTMKEALRQVAITVISPNNGDIEGVAHTAASFTHALTQEAMITIDITHENPSSEEQLTPKEKWKKAVE